MGKQKNVVLLCTIVIAVLIISLVGCTQQQVQPTQVPTTTQSPTTIKPETSTLVPVTPQPTLTTTKPAPSPAATVFKWKVGTCDTGEILKYVQYKYDRIKEMSGGRLEITALPGGALVPDPEMLQATAAGVMQMVENAPAWNSGKYPEADLQYGIPGTIRTLDDNRALISEYGWLQVNREIMKEQGVYLISHRNNGGFNFWTTKKTGPIRTLQEIKGLKVRAFGAFAKVFEGLGASPTYLPHAESYMALSLGTISAYCTALSGYMSYKHYEMCPYYMVPAVGAGTIAHILVNPKSWSSLSSDLQKILEVGSMLDYYERYYFMEAEAPSVFSSNSFNSLKEKGYSVELIQMSAELQGAITEQGMKLLDIEAAKSPRCARMVNDIKKLMKVQGYIK